MSLIIDAKNLNKRYGTTKALDGVDLKVEKGRILGLIGPNGAGKTTLLKALLGLTSVDGDLSVLGLDPRSKRHELMQKICFIADVAVLPRWLKVNQALEFVAGVHPRFNRDKAEAVLAKTDIRSDSRVRELSKGMIVQLHLAIVMAIDAELLILDEPTLGLDILFRKAFYEQLLNEYFDEERTILITTHQVEEVENLLTDLVFIKDGRILLDESMETVGERYTEVRVRAEQLDNAQALGPIARREVFGRQVLMFDSVERQQLAGLGELHQPSIADLFVAKIKGVI